MSAADYIPTVHSSKLEWHHRLEFQNTKYLFEQISGLLGDDLLSEIITLKHKSKYKPNPWLHNVCVCVFSPSVFSFVIEQRMSGLEEILEVILVELLSLPLFFSIVLPF